MKAEPYYCAPGARMHARLFDGLELVPAAEQQEWRDQLPVDSAGQPTSELAAEVLSVFFRQPEAVRELQPLAEELFVDPRQLLVMLTQLCIQNLVEEEVAGSLRYRRTVYPWNWRLFERVQQRMELRAIPVKKIGTGT